MPNGLERCMSFTINNKLSFVGNFRFLRSNSLVKNLGKNYCEYLSQEFYDKVLDPVKQKGFYSYEYLSDFEKFKEKCLARKSFIVQ